MRIPRRVKSAIKLGARKQTQRNSVSKPERVRPLASDRKPKRR